MAPRFRRGYLLLMTFSILLLYTCHLRTMRPKAPTSSNRSKSDDSRWNRATPVGYRIRTPGCTMPLFDPFDPSIRPFFFRRPNGSICTGRPNFLTVRNAFPTILVDKLEEHDVLLGDLSCFYKPVYRNGTLQKPDRRYFLGSERPLQFDKPLTKEFLFVECGTRQTPQRSFHSQFLLNPINKKSVERRRRKAARSTPHNLSVLVLGLDSVSYLNLDRHLPKAAKFARENLNAFELRGYNKLGDNSYPNQVPLITGLKDFEANQAAPNGFYDKLTDQFIWEKYGKRGYRTMFLEESPFYGLFNYRSQGFRRAPADYYLRPVIMAMDESPMNIVDRQGIRCLGPTMPFEELLDYLARFTDVMAGRPFFSYTWISEITHDSLNGAGYADEPFSRLLEKLYSSGALNHTVLIFLSDHGSRFGDIRATYIGRFEDRQPFAFLAFPPWFLKQNPGAARNLGINQHRLTTPFDVHAMLVELLDYPNLERPNTTYGISLLHEVPDTRTCADASISHHWCTCNAEPDVVVSNSLAAALADHLVSRMNNWLAKTARRCAEYQLLQVMDVTALQATPAERAVNTSHYLVAVKLSPGEIVLEGTVRVRGDNYFGLNLYPCHKYSRVSYCARKEWEKLCYCRRSAGGLI